MKHHKMFIDMAECAAACSTAQRKKVGSIIVRNNRILSLGYNGTFSGADNTCEYMVYDNFLSDEPILQTNSGIQYQLKTHDETLHSEFNAISKLARDGESALNSTLYVTLSPCKECAKLIKNVGITKVICKELYRNSDGISLLKKFGVEVYQFTSNGLIIC